MWPRHWLELRFYSVQYALSRSLSFLICRVRSFFFFFFLCERILLLLFIYLDVLIICVNVYVFFCSFIFWWFGVILCTWQIMPRAHTKLNQMSSISFWRRKEKNWLFLWLRSLMLCRKLTKSYKIHNEIDDSSSQPDLIAQHHMFFHSIYLRMTHFWMRMWPKEFSTATRCTEMS